MCIRRMLAGSLAAMLLLCFFASRNSRAGAEGDRLAAPYETDGLTPLYEKASEYILRQPGVPRKGYCFVHGARRGRLAFHLAASSSLRILGAEEDEAELSAGRQALHKAGVYGRKIALQRSSPSKLRYRGYVAALVVSDAVIAEGECPGSASELFRMLRPHGGVAIIGQPPGCPKALKRAYLEDWLSAGGLAYTITESRAEGLWARIDRGPLPGAGEWTHMLADVGNTACSGDTRTTNTSGVLWFGAPGPAIMVDRHWEPVSPLYKAGRLIIPGADRIICSDAYNGARLWDMKAPNAARIAMMRDAGWLALDDSHLYVAVEDKCLEVDAESGRVVRTLTPPAKDADWGYLAIDGDRLFGSEQKRGASYLAARTGRGAEGNQLGRGDYRLIIVSNALFCLDKKTGEPLWRYESEGHGNVIANVTICMGGGGVYFFESTAPNAVRDEDGRVSLADFADGAGEFLVKVDAATGKVAWRRQRDMPSRHVMHLSYARGVLIASGCNTVPPNYWYHLRAHGADDGAPLWQRDLDSTFATSDTDHGKQDKHPLIVGDVVHLKQGSFNLYDGSALGASFSTSNCADCSASMNHVFTRNRSVATIINLREGGAGAPLCSAMRPGCYISIIPAGGIIMLPAFSAGCTCSHTLQTSIAWLPK